MILIDTNALIVLLLGIIDKRLINRHERTSIYNEQDFNDLLAIIGSFDKLIVLPNVWTEVDNLLNRLHGRYKDRYVQEIIKTIKSTTETYLESVKAAESVGFFDLGLTDSLLLEHAKGCKLLITSDSQLSDYALGYGIRVYDMVKSRNDRF